MHGTRDVALNAHHRYKAHLEDIGFIQGNAFPCIFQQPEKNLKLFVHGGDYVLSGYHQELKRFGSEMKRNMSAKHTCLDQTHLMTNR